MALPTPPTPTPSPNKRAGFMEPLSKFIPFEDFYGQQNEDEQFDRFPDECEEEASSDNDHAEKLGTRTSFFAQFVTSERKRIFVDQRYKRFGEINVGQGMYVSRLEAHL